MPGAIIPRRNVLHRIVPVASGPTTPTQWNPADKTSGLNISNVGRTVSYPTGGNSNQALRSIASNTTNQLIYIEHVLDAITTNLYFGFATSAAVLAFGESSADNSPTRSFGYNSSNGAFHDQDSADNTLTAIPGLAATNRIGIAYNTSTQKVWARKNGGAWNASAGGGQDPVAGTGGFSVVLTGSPFFAWVGFDANNGDQITTHFASADWVDAAPSGYTQLA